MTLEYDWEEPEIHASGPMDYRPWDIRRVEERTKRLAKEEREAEMMGLYRKAYEFMNSIRFLDPDVSHEAELKAILKGLKRMQKYEEFPRYKRILENTEYRAKRFLGQIRAKKRADQNLFTAFLSDFGVDSV